MVNFPNIPEPGARFRLRARDSGYVIYSRTQHPPLVWHSNDPAAEDQVFKLIHGTGQRKNLYAIKSVLNGRVLFSRDTGVPPYVGNVANDGLNNDNWFQFIQDDDDPDSFRIYSLSSDTVLYSCATANPQFGNYVGEEDDDQLWHFEIV